MRPLDTLNSPVVLNVESTRDPGKDFVQNDKKKISEGISGNGIEKADDDTTQPETLIQDKNAKKKPSN